MLKRIYFQGQAIDYELVRKKVKNLNMRIRADGSVGVSCPLCVSDSAVERFVADNAERIIRFKEKMRVAREEEAFSVSFADNEMFYVRGDKKRILNRTSSDYGAYVLGDLLIIESPAEQNAEEKKNAVTELIGNACIEESKQAFDTFHGFLDDHQLPFPNVSFRKMRSRWGSCIPSKNKITLNKLLGCVPYECVEYVVLHEMCHLIHPNHSKAFYSLMRQYMPDHERRKNALKHYALFLADF